MMGLVHGGVREIKLTEWCPVSLQWIHFVPLQEGAQRHYKLKAPFTACSLREKTENGLYVWKKIQS